MVPYIYADMFILHPLPKYVSRLNFSQGTIIWFDSILIIPVFSASYILHPNGNNDTIPWWRHQMETFSALLANLCREFTGPRWIPHSKASDAEGALMFSLICVWINGWVSNGEAGDLRRYRAHYNVTVMPFLNWRAYLAQCTSSGNVSGLSNF